MGDWHRWFQMFVAWGSKKMYDSNRVTRLYIFVWHIIRRYMYYMLHVQITCIYIYSLYIYILYPIMYSTYIFYIYISISSRPFKNKGFENEHRVSDRIFKNNGLIVKTSGFGHILKTTPNLSMRCFKGDWWWQNHSFSFTDTDLLTSY